MHISYVIRLYFLNPATTLSPGQGEDADEIAALAFAVEKCGEQITHSKALVDVSPRR